MGGHGGLNILPQKSWNVYNYENREKVRRDEEAAAKEEQLKREQSRKRDTEFRLEQLRAARGLPSQRVEAEPSTIDQESESKHINLFQGLSNIPDFGSNEKEEARNGDSNKKKKQRREEKEAKKPVILPEDEKYRLGYGVAGKGVKAPWYLLKPNDGVDAESDRDSNCSGSGRVEKKPGKKTLEELREERRKREMKENERERALLRGTIKNGDRAAPKFGRFSRR